MPSATKARSLLREILKAMREQAASGDALSRRMEMRLSPEDVGALDWLVAKGYASNRSAAVREGIRMLCWANDHLGKGREIVARRRFPIPWDLEGLAITKATAVPQPEGTLNERLGIRVDERTRDDAEELVRRGRAQSFSDAVRQGVRILAWIHGHLDKRHQILARSPGIFGTNIEELARKQ